MRAVFIIVKFGFAVLLKSSSCTPLAAFRSLRLSASWQAYPLLYGHLIFKVQRVSSITPFQRFYLIYSLVRKNTLPYVLTERRQIIRFFENFFQFAANFSVFTKELLLILCNLQWEKYSLIISTKMGSFMGVFFEKIQTLSLRINMERKKRAEQKNRRIVMFFARPSRSSQKRVYCVKWITTITINRIC